VKYVALPDELADSPPVETIIADSEECEKPLKANVKLLAFANLSRENYNLDRPVLS
jgi:hypothetical protein